MKDKRKSRVLRTIQHGANKPGGAGSEPRAYRMRPSSHPRFDQLISRKTSGRAKQPGPKSGDDLEAVVQPSPLLLWWVLSGIVAVMLGIGTIITIQVSGMDDALTVRQAPITQGGSFDPGLARDWIGHLPTQLADQFVRAQTIEERLKLVREPEQTAALMEEFYQNEPGANEKILETIEMDIVSNGTIVYHRFHVVLENGGSRLLCVVLTDNRAKVDFKSYARYSSATWKDLLGGKALTASEVRVIIRSGFAYLFEYSDDGIWSSYIATTPDWDEHLYFYALRGSKADQALQELTQGGQTQATLAIRSVGNSHEKRQFEVTDFLVGGWCF